MGRFGSFFVYGAKNSVIFVRSFLGAEGAEWSKFLRKKGVKTIIFRL